jgi:hypothetical protein
MANIFSFIVGKPMPDSYRADNSSAKIEYRKVGWEKVNDYRELKIEVEGCTKASFGGKGEMNRYCSYFTTVTATNLTNLSRSIRLNSYNLLGLRYKLCQNTLLLQGNC